MTANDNNDEITYTDNQCQPISNIDSTSMNFAVKSHLKCLSAIANNKCTKHQFIHLLTATCNE